jgi:hypothetical protein
MVLDADTGAVVGEIPNTEGVHGIAIATDLGRGFTSNGCSSTITIPDLKTLKVVDQVKSTGENPDAHNPPCGRRYRPLFEHKSVGNRHRAGAAE